MTDTTDTTDTATDTTPRSQRVKRPDPAVEPASTGADAAADAAPASTEPSAAASLSAFKRPFRAEGTQVFDVEGRLLCSMIQPHLDLDAREALAQEIASALT